MTQSDSLIWAIILGIALGTFALRFSFLGLIGGRALPEWVLRLLRYTPVAVIPGLMAPQIFRATPETGYPDPALVCAVAVALAVGVWRKNAIWAMLAGAGTLAAITFSLS